MDFLNKSFAQLTDLFQGMTAGARITTGLLLVVVVVSVGYLFAHATAGPDVYLLDGTPVSYGELNAMEAALGNANLPYEMDGNRIRVPRGEKYKYMAALSTADALPKNFGDYLESAVANQSVFASGKSSEQRLKIGKQKELAKIIEEIDGIEKAAVFFDEDTKGGLRRDKIKTASVSVRPLGTGELDERQVQGICGTMLGAIAGLKAENVKILNMRTGRYHRVNSADLDASGGTRDRIKQKYEKEYKAKVESLLIDIPDAIVATNVELTPEKSIFQEETKYDPKPVTRGMKEKTSTREFTGEDPSGRPGYVSQANAARGLGAQRKGSTETEETSDLDQQNLVSGTRSTTEIEGHDIVRVVASVSIPSTYLEKLWHQDNDVEGEEPTEPDETALAQIQAKVTSEIQNLVAPQLQVGDTKVAPAELVQVGFLDAIAPEPIPEASLTENAVTWLGQSWGTLGLIGLGFFSLLMIRSMIKSPLAPEAGEAVAVAEVARPEGEESSGEPERKLTSFGTSGRSLKEELTELVSEDPDTAAVILRNWIGNVAKTT